MFRALLLMTSLAFAGAAAAQYKWVDKNGKLQYGDTPPPGVSASALRPPSAVSQPEAPAKTDDARKGPLTTAEKDAEFRKRQQEAEKDRQKQAQAQQQAEDKRENCSRAQEALRTLESGRVTRTDAKGERHFLDDAQLSQEKVKARQAAQQWCN
jgi:hypothetical protein